ncbi:hypothetical protein XF30_30290, partial [Bradyrhizobium sp. SUTN9-2]
MTGFQQQTEDYGQLDPQGIFGSILGGAAGRVIGNLLGGKKGKQIGGAIGNIGGGFLPFSAGPDMQGTVQVSDMELQGFWSVLKKIGQGVQTGVNVGKQLGVFSAQPGLEPAAAQVSDMELQSFWSVLKKIGQGVQT